MGYKNIIRLLNEWSKVNPHLFTPQGEDAEKEIIRKIIKEMKIFEQRQNPYIY